MLQMIFVSKHLSASNQATHDLFHMLQISQRAYWHGLQLLRCLWQHDALPSIRHVLVSVGRSIDRFTHKTYSDCEGTHSRCLTSYLVHGAH